MASWSIHSYSASCAESVVGDPPFEAPYPTTGQSNTSTHAQPIQEMAPPGIEASNTMEFMFNPVFSPLQYLIPPTFVDPSITQHAQLPSFADLQDSSTIPIMPLPSLVEHSSSSQLLPSGFISDENRNLYQQIPAPNPNNTSISDFEPVLSGHDLSDPGVNSWPRIEDKFRKEAYQRLFRYWVSAARLRKCVVFLLSFL